MVDQAPNTTVEAPSWFCDRGNFWGTINQLCLCAKCGRHEHKRHDEPRHYAHIFKPTIHLLCDGCYDSLPDDGATSPARALEGAGR